MDAATKIHIEVGGKNYYLKRATDISGNRAKWNWYTSEDKGCVEESLEGSEMLHKKILADIERAKAQRKELEM